jgi:hypothetical protein
MWILGMTKLYRPYIPLRVREQVIDRQIAEANFRHGYVGEAAMCFSGSRLEVLIKVLFGHQPVQLDHNPALENRPFNKRTMRYTPDANDPDYLIYRTKEAHKIKTLVRGDGAQLSDAAIARKRKRKERKAKRRKTKWPKQKLRSANRWPAKRFVDRRWSGYRIDAPRRKS